MYMYMTFIFFPALFTVEMLLVINYFVRFFVYFNAVNTFTNTLEQLYTKAYSTNFVHRTLVGGGYAHAACGISRRGGNASAGAYPPLRCCLSCMYIRIHNNL